MSLVSNIALRYIIFSERILQTRKCNIPALRKFQVLNNFAKTSTKYEFKNCIFNRQQPLFLTSYKPLSVKPSGNAEKEEKFVESNSSEEKLTRWQLLKKMYKEYWYITVPVHLVTSAGWFGGFYYIATSGVDIVSYMEYLGFSEFIIKPFRDSSMGYVAAAYALYKIFTPLRYTVTLGGTTFSINYLKKRGYIKPVPSKAEIQKKIGEKKDMIQESLRETKRNFKQRKQNISDDLAHYRSEIKSIEDIKSSKTDKNKIS